MLDIGNWIGKGLKYLTHIENACNIIKSFP